MLSLQLRVHAFSNFNQIHASWNISADAFFFHVRWMLLVVFVFWWLFPLMLAFFPFKHTFSNAHISSKASIHSFTFFLFIPFR